MAKRGFTKLAAQKNIYGYLFILPAVSIIFLFQLYPIITGAIMSLMDWDVLNKPEFIEFANYVELFSDETFIIALTNTLKYTFLTVPIIIIFSLIIAMMLNTRIKGINLYRAIYFIPVLSSSVAISIVWKWIFNNESGLLNYFLYSIGLPVRQWLTEPLWAFTAVIIVSVWSGLGTNIVIILAGLQDIPQVYYEVGRMESSSTLRIIRHVTMPMISPTIFFVSVMSIISSFQVFDSIFALTGGGPARSTLVIVLRLYTEAFKNFRMGYAAAMSYILFIIILVITLIQWMGRKRWVHFENNI